jgi:hypothetical protein
MSSDFADAFEEMPDPNAPAQPGAGAQPGGTGASAARPSPPPLSGLTPLGAAVPLQAHNFLAYPAKHKVIYRPTREFWSVDGANSCFPKRMRMKFTNWLARQGQRVTA